MAEVSWDSFERYRQKGLDARRAGQWDSARVYLLEAARVMTAFGKQAQSEELRSSRQAIAERLLELARDCDEAKRRNRKPAPAGRRASSGGEQSAESESGSSENPWLVTEKPS